MALQKQPSLKRILVRVALLLCAAVFFAAMDQIPDPPAISPALTHAHEFAMTLVTPGGGSGELLKQAHAWPERASESRHWLRQAAEATQQEQYWLALTRQASNTSPPVWSL